MNSKNKIHKNALKFISITIIIIYFMYIYYYYNEITISSFVKHTVGSLNILSNDIKYVINRIISYNDVLNTLIIMGSAFIIIKYTNVSEILKNITNFEAGPVKVALDVENVKTKLEELEKDSEEENVATTTEKEEKKVELDNKVHELSFESNKIKIMQLLIDNPEIVEIIERFMNNSRSVVIPIKLIHSHYKIECIKELFNWEFKSNSIKITSIREDISPALIDVYAELKSKDIIYSTN